ncbi:MAG: hypothetical protein JOZ50_10825 [Candidatus Eremiobacteraeota bacterium]|nr:hypothetical protein [Candidatus Eremiobacteraeota bacterium]MBV8596724.1 hypothetical protein [Candidatus Eremiobacteraeota bacterium]
MKRHALQAVGELERRADALMRAALAHAHEFAHNRARLIALVAEERRLLLTVGQHESFRYHVLTARTLWSATRASLLVQSCQHELTTAAKARQERLHWAACRRGLERRARCEAVGWRA